VRPFPRINSRPCSAALATFLLGAGALSAQQPKDLPTPPNFSQTAVATAADAMVQAWAKWKAADAGLEQRLLRLPTAETRDLVQRASAGCREFLEKRRAYSEAVTAYIGQSMAETRPRQPVVTLGAVYEDQVQLLGVNLNLLTEKLDTLRDAPAWIAIRRAVRADMADAFKLQSSRRAEVPLDLSLKRPQSVSIMPAPVYRDSEHQVAEVLGLLWTRYYAALIEATAGTAGSPQAPESAGPTGSAPAARAPDNPLAGVWTYSEGSQQFNGVAEPIHVILELRMENGALTGRYQAELPDFQGTKKVDLRLSHGTPSGPNQQTFEFESKDPAATGHVILETPDPAGKELMLVRAVMEQSPIPRGRERLQRR
jgi:hypothetical protein